METRQNKLNELINIILNKHNFALVYISLLVLRSVFFLQEYVDIGCKICLGWGVIIASIDLWKYRLKFFKVHNSYIPLLLCVVYAISVLLNYKYSLYGGVKNLMYCGIYFFVLYAIRHENDKETFYKFFRRNNDVFIVINALIAVASIATFILGLRFIYFVDENQYKVGFWFNRLNGVCNSNMETILGLISVVLCIINWYLCGKSVGKKKILYITNMVLQFIYYALSGSRAATICYSIMLVAVLAFYVFPWIKMKKGAFKSVICVLAIFLLFAVGEHYLTLGTQFIMKQTAYVVSNLKNSETGDVEEEIEFERVEDFESGDITNNRSSMWNVAFKVIKQYPIFGVAYADQLDSNGDLKGNLDATVFTDNDINALKAAGFYFHNGFIQILLCGGFVFTVLFLILAVKKAYDFFRYVVSEDRNTREYKMVLWIFVVIVALFVDNMVEVHLLFAGQDGVASFLWYLLGCGIFLIDGCKQIKAGEEQL